jgi:uncharacterized protein YacL
MLLLIIRLLYFFVCAGAIAALVGNETKRPEFAETHTLATFAILFFISQIVTIVDLVVKRKRIEVISAIYFGLLIGVLLSFLLMLAIAPVLDQVGYADWTPAVNSVVTLVLSYLSVALILQTKDDFRFIIPYVEFSRELKGGRPLILDSSALIDGRISDVVETRMIDSQMIVPSFVLKEVQDIADSSDKSRRIRGRRGLDVLSKLQKIPHAEISVYESDDTKGKSIDQRLIDVSKLLAGRIVTNDFNLTKVANVQGVDVINLNDVASALRPRYLPGERLRVKVQREGESYSQGVGYLDDGTMVVCEQAQNLIGKDIDAIVTSVLQSSAGRMIFARPEGADPEPETETDQPQKN